MTTKSNRVLVVDDDHDNATFVADIATDAGLSATTAESGDAALKVLERGGFDLLVTDIRMSGMDGIQLIERVRGRDDRIAIIAITAFGSLQTGLRALKAGASDYLPKPFDPNEHEAVSQAVSEDAAPGTVLEVLQTGYRIGERLLRPALVVVAKAPPLPEPGASGSNGHDPDAT